MRFSLRPLLPPLLAAASALSAFADVVSLSDGRVLEGRVEADGDDLVIRRGPGAVRVPRRLVVKRVTAPAVEDVYADRAKALAPADAVGHFDLGRWCRENALRNEAETEFLAAIRADPDHAGAREALGQVKTPSGWKTDREIQEAKGLVRHEGKWITPAERDLAAARTASDEIRKKTRSEVRALVQTAGGTDPAKAEEAARKLEAFPPEDLLPALRDGLRSSKAGLRRFTAGRLGRLRDADSLKRLASMALRDPDPGAAQAGLDAILDMKVSGARLLFVNGLAESNPGVRIRTADVLAGLGDPLAAPALLAAAERLERVREQPLTVEQTDSVVVPGGVVRGSGGPPTAVIPRVITRVQTTRDLEQEAAFDRERDAYLSALRRLTGKDFGTEASAWRRGLSERPR